MKKYMPFEPGNTVILQVSDKSSRAMRVWKVYYKYIILKIRENRCRPQSAEQSALWTAVSIEIAVNPVFGTLLMKHIKSLSESK